MSVVATAAAAAEKSKQIDQKWFLWLQK